MASWDDLEVCLEAQAGFILRFVKPSVAGLWGWGVLTQGSAFEDCDAPILKHLAPYACAGTV